jgi:hypothetical protein
MSKVRLTGSTSGYTELTAPASAGNNTLVLPTGNGSNGQILGTDGAGNLSWVGGRMVLETAKASTSGTSVDFTGIPSWVKRVTVMFNGVSTNGTSIYLIQLGDSGGIETTSYTGSTLAAQSSFDSSAAATSTAGFAVINANVAGYAYSGLVAIVNISGNSWIESGTLVDTSAVRGSLSSGSKTLSNTLDRLRITTVNGTDTFDEGTINLLLEG